MAKTNHYLLVDSHELLVDGIIYNLKQIDSQSTFYKLHALAQVKSYLINYGPDMVFIGLSCNHNHGLHLIDNLRQSGWTRPIIAISDSNESHLWNAAIQVGINAILLRSYNSRQLTDTLNALIKKGYYLPASIKHQARETSNKTPKVYLGQRQYQVLLLISKGYKTRQIASMLNVSENTIKTHRKEIYKKLKAKNSVDLIRRAIAANLLVHEYNKVELA